MHAAEMPKLEKEAQEGFAIRVLGRERYGNSPCQAHPLELVEQFIKEQAEQIAALSARS